ncbi:hypothetical protein BGW37DRAFT_168695 [Umbelopsis sp. PMI_123]|nr:hypothetical protein BGW37DRAFT_168695 [Umbelopsis sp. PMI_123]
MERYPGFQLESNEVVLLRGMVLVWPHVAADRLVSHTFFSLTFFCLLFPLYTFYCHSMLQEQASDSDRAVRNFNSAWTNTMGRLHDPQSPSITSWDQSKSGYDSRNPSQDDINCTMQLPQETAIPAPRRPRLNSYKNPKDNDGRQEVATLAVVFGREEYTEPKPLWERQGDQGHVEIKVRTVVRTSYARSSASDAQSISHIVDSSFADISEELTRRSSFSQSLSDSASPKFSLPPIPQIASFPEYSVDDSSLPYTDTDDSIRSISPTISDQAQSSHSPKRISYHSNRSSTYEEYDIAPPLLFLDYPPAIFDALVSDVDERIIVWGTDPNKPGPKNISIAENSTPPSATKGFSANATSPTVQPPTPSLRRKISQNFINSAIGTSLRNIGNHREKPSSVLDDRGSSFSNEPSISSELPTATKSQSTMDSMVIEAATVEKLVEKLTIVLDYGFLTDFFLTYRTFISPLQLCKLLILRFRWSFINDDENRRVVRIRTFVVIRHWLLNYFVHDFIPSRQLRITLTSYINQLAFHPLVRQSVRDQRIVKGLKRVIRRLKMVYYRKKTETNNVRIISPPPLTPKQEQIEKLVRDKLMQNPVRRTATTSLSKFKWAGAKMNGNTAISDANLASVVVIGNIDRKGAPSTNLQSDLAKKIFGKANKRALSLTDIRTSGFSRTTQRSNAVNVSRENDKFVSIKTLQMRRRAEMEKQQSEAEREQERQRQLEGRPLSIASDDSLESEITVGTTEDELDQASDDDDSVLHKEKEYEEEFRGHELEMQRRRLEEEEEMKRVKFYTQGDITSTPKDDDAIPQSLDIFENLHAHTVYVDQSRKVTLPMSSAASADAVMVTGRKHPKRPGLPADFLAAASQNITSLPPNDPSTANATASEKSNSSSKDNVQDQDATVNHLQGNQFPSGFAKELSQKSIERRRSERDLRQLYLKNSQSDRTVDDIVPTTELIPPVPKISNTYIIPLRTSDEMPSIASETGDDGKDLEKTIRKTPSGRLVNMIAQELRRENLDHCECEACQGITNDTSKCKRLSTLLSADRERRKSIELRHRRGASVDRLSEVTRSSTTGYEVINFQEGSQVVSNITSENGNQVSAITAASTGLSSEAADTIASLPYVELNSVPVLQDIDLLRQVNKNPEGGNGTINLQYPQMSPTSLRGLERVPSVVSALRTVQLKEQHSDINSEVAELAVATSSAGVQDAISEPSSVPSSYKPGEAIQHHLEVIQTDDGLEYENTNNPTSPPRMHNEPNHGKVPKTKSEARPYLRRSFILYESSGSIAQQLCLVERDVLLAVQWEELVHCRWTKMNTNIDGQDDVQDAIQRFNIVCQWVASEIVRSPSLEDRVRTIEKFIRIAQVEMPYVFQLCYSYPSTSRSASSSCISSTQDLVQS